MNIKTKKILDLINKDEEIGTVLFSYSKLTKKYSANNFSEIILEGLTPKGVEWLFLTYYNYIQFVGINHESDMLYSVQDGKSFELCKGLQNIPYEFLLIKCYEAESQTLYEVFKAEPEIKKTLIRYEKWCHDNNIELDKDNIYHKNGVLFTEYFDKEEN